MVTASFVDAHGVRHQLTLCILASVLRVKEALCPLNIAGGKLTLWERIAAELPNTAQGWEQLFSLYPSLAPAYAAAA